jgi:hypothetical protein
VSREKEEGKRENSKNSPQTGRFSLLPVAFALVGGIFLATC